LLFVQFYHYQLLLFHLNYLDGPVLPRPLNELQYHGTTTLAFKFNDGVIVAVDSKASVGSYVGSRTVKKVFPISSHILATMAGGAADCAFWIRRTARQVKVYICIDVHKDIYRYKIICVYIHMNTFLYIYVYIHICICIYMYMYIYIYICISIYK
jgi:hypothetical protein